MDEEIERLVVSVRADTSGLARDVADMRGQLEGSLGAGADRAGAMIEDALGRAVRTGKLGFDDLRRVALAVMAEIAAAAMQAGMNALGGGSGGGGSGGNGGGMMGLIQTGMQILGAMGFPGRATGGPVSPGAAYMVGERGPELFVPTASGRIEPLASGGGRDVRVAISINAPGGNEPQALARSGRQVARAVRAALEASQG